MDQEDVFAELTIGPAAIKNYSRMSYTMWNAFAEFIDNSTQSRLNYEPIIDAVLAKEGTPLIVEIDYNVLKREITIKDNSIGMSGDDLIAALKIAHPTQDSKGRSRYGMGMKTAACWIGNNWKIETCEWSSGQEWTAIVDVEQIAYHKGKVPLTVRDDVSRDEHYTRITISNLNRNLQKRTEETIKGFLGSIYRFDLAAGRLKILYRGEEIRPPDEYNFDTDPTGKPMKLEIPETEFGGKTIRGFVGVLKQGAGGRKFGGFSLFQNKRQIQGFPNAWKPRNIFGGVDDEGANNLVAQRLTGLIELDEKFKVSHTKDAILFEGDEEEQLEDFLEKITKDYREYARRRRGDDRGQPWKREKVRELISDMANEFTSSEIKDAITTSILPPLETIVANNLRQVANLSQSDKMATFEITPALRVDIWLRETSEFEPYVTLAAGADAGTMHVIVNRLHPYYAGLESSDTIEECIRQYIYDAIAEYQVSHQTSKLNPDSVRRLKDQLLRAKFLKIDNAAAAATVTASEAPSSAAASPG
jgi:hypothetical protein